MNIHPIHAFLEMLDDKSVDYACWKDLDLLDAVFAGKKDLDIIVCAADKEILIQLAKDFGALILRNRFDISGDLIHVFIRGEDESIFHIHIYTRLITGESWVKEYHFPIERQILDNRIWDHIYKIWSIPQNLNQELIILRYFLKITSVISLYAYRKKRIDARNYVSLISKKPAHDIFLNLSIMLKNKKILYNSEEIKNHYFTALKIRKKFLKYRRLSTIRLFSFRLNGLKDRFLNKYLYNENKILPSHGFVLAITGVDGSGKSSLIKSTENYFSKILTTRRSHIGRPYPDFVSKVYHILQDKNRSKNKNDSKQNTSLLKSIFALFLALLRLHKAQKIMRLANKGYLVLVDRWPTQELGKMDGPRIQYDQSASLFTSNLGKLEHYIYKKIPCADMCIILNVTLEVAQLRNFSRQKVNKETKQQIEQRFYLNQEFVPKSKTIINYNNTSEFMTAKHDIIKLCWGHISGQVS